MHSLGISALHTADYTRGEIYEKSVANLPGKIINRCVSERRQ